MEMVRAEPRPEPALHAEEQHKNEAGNDRRNRERQINQCNQQALAQKLNFAIVHEAATPNTRSAARKSKPR